MRIKRILMGDRRHLEPGRPRGPTDETSSEFFAKRSKIHPPLTDYRPSRAAGPQQRFLEEPHQSCASSLGRRQAWLAAGEGQPGPVCPSRKLGVEFAGSQLLGGLAKGKAEDEESDLHTTANVGLNGVDTRLGRSLRMGRLAVWILAENSTNAQRGLPRLLDSLARVDSDLSDEKQAAAFLA